MKGFPNQVADLGTLASAMGILTNLVDQGENPKRDDVFGEALIRRGVLGTGHTRTPIEQYLTSQRTKKPSDQSFRTRARGLRELFRVLGLINDAGREVLITGYGRQIAALAARELTEEGVRIWRLVVRNMSHDGGDGETSHPYQVLLRLVGRRPDIPRAKCALALEAKNDTDAELGRIAGLAELEEDEILRRIRVSKPTWDNAKKILPRFAEQLGDVVKHNHRMTLTPAPGAALQTPEPGEGARRARGRHPRAASEVTSDTIARGGTAETWDEGDELLEAPLDPETLRQRKGLLRDRLRRHNLIVQDLASRFASKHARLYENPFDCLAVFTTRSYLTEVKTLDGSEQDEVARVRDALAQLLYYEAFVTEPLVGGRPIMKVACFEGPISDRHVRWLRRSDLYAIWKSRDGYDTTEEARTNLARDFDF